MQRLHTYGTAASPRMMEQDRGRERMDWSGEIGPAPRETGMTVSQPPALADMANDLPVEVIQAPTSRQEAYMGSWKALLSRYEGSYVVATFLVGTQNTVSWEGILFDVGSTVGQIARFAPRDRNFNAFCVSLNSFLNLLDHPNAEIALAGGYFHPGTQMLLSEESLNFIYHIRATKLFLSAAGIHETMGISCANRFEVPVKNAMLKSSDKCVLVADSSKFGVVRASHVCDLEQVDAIITDDELPDHWARFIEDRGITLHRVHLERGKNCD